MLFVVSVRELVEATLIHNMSGAVVVHVRKGGLIIEWLYIRNYANVKQQRLVHGRSRESDRRVTFAKYAIRTAINRWNEFCVQVFRGWVGQMLEKHRCNIIPKLFRIQATAAIAEYSVLMRHDGPGFSCKQTAVDSTFQVSHKKEWIPGLIFFPELWHLQCQMHAFVICSVCLWFPFVNWASPMVAPQCLPATVVQDHIAD